MIAAEITLTLLILPSVVDGCVVAVMLVAAMSILFEDDLVGTGVVEDDSSCSCEAVDDTGIIVGVILSSSLTEEDESTIVTLEDEVSVISIEADAFNMAEVDIV